MERSHKCVYNEVRVQPKIFLWYLLINLKNNNLLKELLKCANRKCKYFNNYKNKNKIKKNTWRYHHFIPVYQQSL